MHSKSKFVGGLFLSMFLALVGQASMAQSIGGFVFEPMEVPFVEPEPVDLYCHEEMPDFDDVGDLPNAEAMFDDMGVDYPYSGCDYGVSDLYVD